jgi:hypothetical protein
MRTQQTRCFAAHTVPAIAVLSGLTACAPAGAAAPHTMHAAAATHIVRAGQSIQRAVDGAKPGDTIVIGRGTYRESVQVAVSDLTIRGAGRGTVIRPATAAKPNKPAKPPKSAATPSKAAKPAKPAKPAATPSKAAKAAKPANACAAAGNGICVTGTAQRKVSGVRISSLTVKGFSKNGVWGVQTDRMSVRRVLAENNGQQGIGQEKSTRGLFTDNTSRNNAESGIFLANTVSEEGGATDTRGTVVRHNVVSGNRVGVVIRRLRNLRVDDNSATSNCGGIFVVGDEGTPHGGALTVIRNRVTSNNRYCAATARLPFFQGAGIVLTGVEKTVVTANDVRNNVGASSMSGGIVLYASVVGAPNTGNSVTRNTVQGNKPADLADRDTKGSDNTFSAHSCASSEPASLCGKATP